MDFLIKGRILDKSNESIARDSSAAGERKRWVDEPTVRCKPHHQRWER